MYDDVLLEERNERIRSGDVHVYLSERLLVYVFETCWVVLVDEAVVLRTFLLQRRLSTVDADRKITGEESPRFAA